MVLKKVRAAVISVPVTLFKVMADPGLIKTALFTINNFLRQEQYKAALAVLKGFRNGAV